MANDNNNINQLVPEDDDPTAELEIPNFAEAAERESDAHTFDVNESQDSSRVSVPELQSDLQSRQETISRLQYDIEQLHAKWAGLEAEINARESQTETLNTENIALNEAVERKEKLIRRRDKNIRALKKEIRQRDEQYRTLIEEFEAVKDSLQQEAQDSSDNVVIPDRALHELSKDDLVLRLERSEEYADSMRHQFQDMIESTSNIERERDQLRTALARTTSDNEELQSDISELQAQCDELQQQLDTIEKRHAEEIRILRFELGEAQDTIVETEQVKNQLASDLIDSRTYKEELERKLSSTEETSRHKIDELRKQMTRMTRDAESYEQKLNTKSEAINVLLAELAKKSEQLESIGDIEDVIHDIDDRITERIDLPPSSTERPTRLLIGTVDGQVLRFPLFKDRLTIGRTEDNDIQLKAAYISRRHAVVQVDREVTRIIDWGSKNGVFANGERVKEHFLQHGDIVTIGNARFRYEERKKRDS
ncbi:MAG: FHA domain-containing protein [Pseudomonadota bacterium]